MGLSEKHYDGVFFCEKASGKQSLSSRGIFLLDVYPSKTFRVLSVRGRNSSSNDVLSRVHPICCIFRAHALYQET